MRILSLLRLKWRARKGASFVELAIVIPLLLTVAFGVVDFARYFWASVILNHAASRAVDFAAKLDIAEDLQTPSTACLQERRSPVCKEYWQKLDDFMRRREAIFAKAEEFLRSAPIGVTLDEYVMTDPDYVDYSNYEFPDELKRSSVMGFVRPGDSAYLSKMPAEFKEISNHPDYPPLWNPCRAPGVSSAQAKKGWPESRGGETWNSVLAECPIVVKFQGTFDPVTPFIQNMPIKVAQLRFVTPSDQGQGIVKGNFEEPSTPTHTGIPTNTIPGGDTPTVSVDTPGPGHTPSLTTPTVGPSQNAYTPHTDPTTDPGVTPTIYEEPDTPTPFPPPPTFDIDCGESGCYGG
jgi:hypothetical protein